MRKSVILGYTLYLQNLVDMRFMPNSINHRYERPLVHGGGGTIKRFSTKSGNTKTNLSKHSGQRRSQRHAGLNEN